MDMLFQTENAFRKNIFLMKCLGSLNEKVDDRSICFVNGDFFGTDKHIFSTINRSVHGKEQRTQMKL